MKIKTPDKVNLKRGWLFRITEKLAYNKTINKFNKEMRKELREGSTTVMYYSLSISLLYKGWRLKAKKDGHKRAIADLEKVYETGVTSMYDHYFDLNKLKELVE